MLCLLFWKPSTPEVGRGRVVVVGGSDSKGGRAVEGGWGCSKGWGLASERESEKWASLGCTRNTWYRDRSPNNHQGA